MSRHRYTSAILLLFSLFCSNCNNDSSNIIDQKSANIVVQYEDQEGLHTDYGAKIFIYYGIYSMDITEFTYSPNGVLAYGNKEIIPNIQAIVQEENTLIKVSNTEKVTIIIESHNFKERTTIDSFSPNNMPIKMKVTFEDLQYLSK